MRRATVIAHCLVNSGMTPRVREAEAAVAQVFREEFPESDFLRWNVEIDERVAADIIKNVGRATTINIRRLIDDLGDPRRSGHDGGN